MTRWARQVFAAVGIWALCLIAGCNGFFVDPNSVAGGGTGSSTADYVFVANANTQSLAVFAVGSGALTAVSGSPFPLGFVPTAVAVNPANTIVYVAGSSSQGYVINAYSIASTGVLSLLTSNNVGVPEVSIDISPDGQWLMGLDSVGTTTYEALVDEFQIVNSSGQLQANPGAAGVFVYPSPVPAINPLQVKFAPSGAYVFAAMGTGGDVVFPFNTANGLYATALWLQPISSGTSEQALAVSPDSTHLYIARSGTSGGLGVYTIGAGGALSSVSGSPLAAGSQPISVVVNKAGTNVYIANQGDGTISGYSVASGGTVTPLNPAADTATSGPRALAIDNSGSYLLAASTSGNPDLTMYSFTSTGELTSVASVATGTDPTSPIAIATTH